jgi:hypothetical protein
MSNTFTVTQITYNFTATVGNPVSLRLEETPDTVTVVNQLNTITVINSVQPVTISGLGGGGQTYNQSLNTTDNVSFASVTTPQIYGLAQQPVYFPTGISLTNVGSSFIGGLDLGGIAMTFTNQLSLIFALLNIDLGTVQQPQLYSIRF